MADEWTMKAKELQEAADQRDMKSFYNSLKAVYGTRDAGTIPICAQDGSTMITDRTGILSRWAEHFNSILNQISEFNFSVVNDIPDWEVDDNLMIPPPDATEVARAISQLSSGRQQGRMGFYQSSSKLKAAY